MRFYTGSHDYTEISELFYSTRYRLPTGKVFSSSFFLSPMSEG